MRRGARDRYQEDRGLKGVPDTNPVSPPLSLAKRRSRWEVSEAR